MYVRKARSSSLGSSMQSKSKKLIEKTIDVHCVIYLDDRNNPGRMGLTKYLVTKIGVSWVHRYGKRSNQQKLTKLIGS